MQLAHDLSSEESSDVGFSLTQLRGFVTLAQTLSYPETAAALGYSEPAVHHQVKRLQESLGCSLFVKSGRTIELTAEGSRLLPQCLLILREAAALPRLAARKRDHEVIVVAAGLVTAAYMLPELLAEVRHKEPRLRVDFEAHPRSELLGLVRSGAADIGIAHSLDQLADPDEFLVSRWRDVDYYLVESPNAELGEEPTIFAVGQMTAPLASAINRMSSSRIVPRVVFLPSADAVRSMTSAGLGFGFLRSQCIQSDLLAGVLRPVALMDMPIRSTVWAIRSQRGAGSTCVARFLELTEARPALAAAAVS